MKAGNLFAKNSPKKLFVSNLPRRAISLKEKTSEKQQAQQESKRVNY
jgi:hypothetical protein